MSTLVWLHEDALRVSHPAYSRAPDDAHWCFIWDGQYFQSQHMGLNRLTFIYETLCEMPNVTLYEGETVACLHTLMKERQVKQLFTAATPNPERQRQMEALASHCQCSITLDEPFVRYPEGKALKRFFPFWNHVKKQLLD